MWAGACLFKVFTTRILIFGAFASPTRGFFRKVFATKMTYMNFAALCVAHERGPWDSVSFFVDLLCIIYSDVSR